MVELPSLSSFNMHVESGGRGVIVTDTEHRVCYTDSQICDLLGITPSEIVGREISAVVRDLLRHRFKDSDEFERHSRWLCENPAETAEDVMELVTPTRRVLHRYSTPLLDAERRPVARIEVFSDITKRRNLEESNVNLYKQACAAYEELKAAQDQLVQSEKLRAIGEIASGVAHDFNNTLGIILGNIQLLMRTIENEKAQMRLKSIEQAALDGAETVRRIREFTRIQPDAPLAPVDLSTLSATVAEALRPGWDDSGREIVTELQLAENALATGIAAEIREVLINILVNAVQAMPEGGKISISTGSDDDTVWLKVRDTGTGMPEDVAKRVFDPFFTTKGVEGTGLGMSVAYGIVKRHNGRISIESTLGAGTTVAITLPRSTNSVAESRSEARAHDIAPARILVVDDEAMFAEVVVDMLSEYGHEVSTARSGDEAIDRFKESEFDLVFTDLGMPGMSGWQLAEGIKAIEPKTPVVLLTGWGARVDAEELAGSSVDMVLAKPIKMEDLSGVVAKALGGSRRR